MPNKSPKYKLVIFDCDQTLVDQSIYKDVQDVVEKLSKLKIKMAIASYNPYAKWFCDRYDITKYFDIICGYNSVNKMKHMTEIKTHYEKKGFDIAEDEMIFFDDDINNFISIEKLTRIKCCYINPDNGVTNDIMNLII
jgi:phosphoglycolate phosphatase-like HAD superfamily hydrolase